MLAEIGDPIRNALESTILKRQDRPEVGHKRHIKIARYEPSSDTATGTYERSVPLVIDILFTFASATSANMDINVKVAHQEIK